MVKPLPASLRTHINANSEFHDDDGYIYDIDGGGGFDSRSSSFVYERRRTNETDDYEFLDEEEDLEDDDVLGSGSINSAAATRRRAESVGRAWRRRGRRDVSSLVEDGPIRSEFHVVFKRRDSHLQHESDYRECENI